jgi:hypothetical protein
MLSCPFLPRPTANSALEKKEWDAQKKKKKIKEEKQRKGGCKGRYPV